MLPGLLAGTAPGRRFAVRAPRAVFEGIALSGTASGGLEGRRCAHARRQTLFIAGQEVGNRFNDEGAQHLVCVIHEVSYIALGDRCNGIRDTFKGGAAPDTAGLDAGAMTGTTGLPVGAMTTKLTRR